MTPLRTAVTSRVRYVVASAIGLVGMIFGGSSPAIATSLPKVAKSSEIDMTFTDSSTPPQYHRSWKGQVRNGVFTITVNAYGTEMAKGSFKVPVTTWARVNVLLPTVLSAKSGASTLGCTGGTSRSLEVRVATKTLVSAEAELCGGPNPKAAAIDAVNNEFLKLVGNFDKFSKRGRQPGS